MNCKRLVCVEDAGIVPPALRGSNKGRQTNTKKKCLSEICFTKDHNNKAP